MIGPVTGFQLPSLIRPMLPNRKTCRCQARAIAVATKVSQLLCCSFAHAHSKGASVALRMALFNTHLPCILNSHYDIGLMNEVASGISPIIAVNKMDPKNRVGSGTVVSRSLPKPRSRPRRASDSAKIVSQARRPLSKRCLILLYGIADAFARGGQPRIARWQLKSNSI